MNIRRESDLKAESYQTEKMRSSVKSAARKHNGLPSWLHSMPANAADWVRSLDGEDPLEKERATHSSILAWEIPWTEEPGGLNPSPWGHREL